VEWSRWLWFCATETVLAVTPGPAVLLIVSLSFTRGSVAGLAGSFGILAANALYFALSATSLGAVLLASYRLFLVIKVAGAAYLVWVGLRMVLGSTAAAAPLPTVAWRRRRRPFSLAFLTQGANPKALVFFTAILPQFVNPQYGVVSQVAVLGLSSIVIEFLVLGAYVLTCSRVRSWVTDGRASSRLHRAGGVLLIGAGAGLAVMRRG
jgi:threonine/homoserine/homoserine lactone efflux protein